MLFIISIATSKRFIETDHNQQVLKRVQEPEVLPGLMDISTAIIAPNASLIATEFSPFGSLLDINNKIRQNTTKVMHESLVMHFSTGTEDPNVIQQPQQETVEIGSTEIGGIRLPRNFHAYGRNNHETWKPALTLEEPDDPSRICHYAKQLVYPAGAGVEYSPEELLARKYAHLLEQRKQQPQMQSNMQEQTPQQQLKKETVYPAGGQQLEQLEQQQLYDSYESENSYYMTAINGEIYEPNEDEADEDHSEADDGEDDADQDQEQSAQSDEESDAEESDPQEDDDDSEPVKQSPYTNGVNAEMQFRTQTTFEQQNRSLKMKFKKERTLESSTYSAYTIESIYHHHQQQELPPPAPTPIRTLPASPKTAQDWSAAGTVAGAGTVQRQRNGGHHFHPYMLGQTSTPKSAVNDNRRARVKAKLGKFQVEPRSNSNSSCSVADQAANGVEAVAPPTETAQYTMLPSMTTQTFHSPVLEDWIIRIVRWL